MKVASKKPTKKASDPTPIYTQVVKSKGFDPLKGKPRSSAIDSIPKSMLRKSNASKQKKG